MRSFSLKFSPVLEKKGAKTDLETSAINVVPPRVLIGFRSATLSRVICVLTDCYDADWSDNLPDVFVISEIP